jgi:ubiquinone/menaquinone biosynthesis C-methylase UbiE
LITPERREKALEEMVRILKPGGKILLSVWSKTQPQKTKRVFNYGNVLVPWKSREGGRNQSYFRYYYIFKLEELEELFKSAKLKIENYVWDYGNEIFTLTYDN